MMAPLYFMVGGVLLVAALAAAFFAYLDWRERHHRA